MVGREGWEANVKTQMLGHWAVWYVLQLRVGCAVRVVSC